MAIENVGRSRNGSLRPRSLSDVIGFVPQTISNAPQAAFVCAARMSKRRDHRAILGGKVTLFIAMRGSFHGRQVLQHLAAALFFS